MLRNAIIISVILSLTAVISNARPDPAVSAVISNARPDPPVSAVVDDVTASNRPFPAKTTAVDLRPLHLTAVANDPDQIAHSFRIPSARHVSRPLSFYMRRPIEILYGHDMLMNPVKKDKMNKMKKWKKKGERDGDDESEIEYEKKRLRKMMKRKRKNGGGFVKWISGFMNRF